jgi:hypothetical protein
MTDPTTAMPSQDYESGNFWIDIQVTDVAPSSWWTSDGSAFSAGTNRRLWPNQNALFGGGLTAISGEYTLGNEFEVNPSATLERLWFWSAGNTTKLPSDCGIWDANAGTIIAGTHLSSVSWKTASGGSASAAGGWMYADYTSLGISLNSSHKYVASVFYGADATNQWYPYNNGYYSTGSGSSGLTNGVLSSPASGSSVNGTGCYNAGSTFAFPGTNPANGEGYFIDVEVSPVNQSAMLAFF